MRYLLDECLCEQATNAMEALRKPADHFAYIAGHEVAHAGAQDPEIPAICKDLGWDVLLTANVRDFGARKVLYQSLLAEGIHVLVVRPGKQKLDEFLQVSLLARHYPKFCANFEVAHRAVAGGRQGIGHQGTRPRRTHRRDRGSRAGSDPALSGLLLATGATGRCGR